MHFRSKLLASVFSLLVSSPLTVIAQEVVTEELNSASTELQSTANTATQESTDSLNTSAELDTSKNKGKKEKPVDEAAEEPIDEEALVASSSTLSATSESGDGGVAGSLAGSQTAADLVSAAGQLKYSVPIAVPKFRRLEPSLALSYNSDAGRRSGDGAFVGAGWSLAGFSSIERVSAGLGVPFYDTGRDIFVADGMELLKCNSGTINVSGADTAPWDYSPDHIATETSAGCDAGGDFVTLKDTYTKIEFDQTNNLFRIYQKNGTVLTYTSIDDLAPSEALAGGENTEDYDNMRKRRKWLLTHVTDTQVTSNIVTYTYSFGRDDDPVHVGNARLDGFAHRPDTITYAGYKVTFKYDTNVIPNSFSTGTSYMGTSYHMLRWIYATEGVQETHVSAYGLTQSETGLTHAQILNSVQQFGSDFTLSADGVPDVSGATSYPATVFEYSDDAFSLVEAGYPLLASDQGSNVLGWWPDDPHYGAPSANSPNTTFHMSTQSADTDGDGRDELIAFPDIASVRICGSGGGKNSTRVCSTRIQYAQRAGRYAFDNDGTATRMNEPDPIELGWKRRVLAVSRWTPEVTDPIVITQVTKGLHDYLSPHDLGTGKIGGGVLAPANVHFNVATGWDNNLTYTGNFDTDPEIEIYRANRAFTTNSALPPEGLYFWDVITDPNSPDGAVGDTKEADIQNYLRSDSTVDWTCKPDNVTVNTSYLKNARVLDMNGDGIDEIFMSVFINDPAGSGGLIHCVREYTSEGFKSRILAASPIIEDPLNPNSNGKEAVGFGDVNGDGIPDAITHAPAESGFQSWSILVGLGRGDGTFSANQEWFGTVDFGGTLSTASSVTTYFGNSVQIRDINADGLADVIISAGQERWTAAINIRPKAGPAKIFLSTGSETHGLVEYTGPTSQIDAFVTSGDFNGDGLTDFARADQVLSGVETPTIYYGSEGHPNRLEGVTTSSGNVIAAEYAPSTSFPDNEVPSGRQVVNKIISGSDPTALRETTFAYSGDRYDYEARKPLGFKTVAITLPVANGETGTVVQTTTYLNDNFINAGLVASTKLTYDGTIYNMVDNTWDVMGAGNGPYRIQKTNEQKTTRYGTSLLTNSKDFTWTVYGEPEYVYDHGFDDNTLDDTWTYLTYAPNTTAYIVNLPNLKRVGSGTDPAVNTSWLQEEQYSYDGNGNSGAPSVGNLSKTAVWNGDLANSALRTTATYAHDAYGNVLTETDALGNTTTHSYETNKNLFLISSTNALGHTGSTTWNAACQQPLTQTDANGLVTTHYYDVMCLGERSTSPTGQDIYTRYFNLGDPTAQYVEREIKIATTAFSETSRFEREYFNGFGETYKTAVSGRLADIEAAGSGASVLLTKYDARGQKLWESNPLTWAAALDNDAGVNERTGFTYDPIGRPLQSQLANGATETITYGAANMAYPRLSTVQQTAKLPYQDVVSAPCDLGLNGDMCQQARSSTDYFGNVIHQARWDTGQTDVTTLTGTERATEFRYDLLGRLTDVQDPEAMVWHYEYDAYGNRLMAEDPGLGRWILEYDTNNNLTKQTDAKGQTIEFSYDLLNRPTRKLVTDAAGPVATYSFYDDDNTATTHDRAAGACGKVANPAYYNIGQLTCQAIGTERTWYNYGITGQVENEDHKLDVGTGSPKTVVAHKRYNFDGSLQKQAYTYLDSASNEQWAWTPDYKYDAAGRLVQFGNDITDVQYDLRGNPTRSDYGNGVIDQRTYSAARGWLIDVRAISVLDGISYKTYTRSGTGRILSVDATLDAGDLAYVYDYTGRLLSATNASGLTEYDQSFTYDGAGRMRSNSKVGAYTYGAAKSVGVNGASPHAHAPAIVDGAAFIYDANGNMTTGLHGKVMEYDGENRPLAVTHNGKRTEYVYGPDGARLKKIEDAGGASPVTTLYAGLTEIRNWQGATEEFLNYPVGDVRWQNGPDASAGDFEYGYLHTDQLGSVVAVSNDGGMFEVKRAYTPFGATADEVVIAGAPTETKSFLGERYDEDAGLLYLNARYYDPELGLFLQPDWLEVTKQGVGTNRYSYAFNDPVNKLDPNGNFFFALFGAILSGLAGASGIAAGLSAALSVIGTALTVYSYAQTIVGVASGKLSIGDAVIGFAKSYVAGRIGGAISKAISNTIANAIGGGALAHGYSGGGGSSGAHGSEVTNPVVAKFNFTKSTQSLTGTAAGVGTSGGAAAGGLALPNLDDLGLEVVHSPTEWFLNMRRTVKLAVSSLKTAFHGNSARSLKPTELYALIETGSNGVSGDIAKFGITSNPKGRYSRNYLFREGVRYETLNRFRTRYPAIVAENIALRGYHRTFGRLPRLNKVFR